MTPHLKIEAVQATGVQHYGEHCRVPGCPHLVCLPAGPHQAPPGTLKD